jgi:agmatine deiminase
MMRSVYQTPPEWFPHEACCLAWPHLRKDWGPNYETALREFISLVTQIAIENGEINERVILLVHDEESERNAVKQFVNFANVTIIRQKFGDIWLRDTAPIWAFNREQKKLTAHTFEFNGWGEKYVFPDDLTLSKELSLKLGFKNVHWNFVLEGGSLEHNGDGVCITTEECLLNSNRNPGMSKLDIEDKLNEAFGFKKVIWLKEGLKNDHTDGHIDNLSSISSLLIPGFRLELSKHSSVVIQTPSPLCSREPPSKTKFQ